MNSRTLKLLEFDKIFELLEKECLSSEGRKLLNEQEFFTERTKLTAFHEVIGEVKRYLESDYRFPDLNFPDILSFVIRSGKSGAVLEGEELYSIADFCISSHRFKVYFTGNKLPGIKSITSLVSEIGDFSGVIKKITSVLDPLGNVRENYPPLKKMRNGLLTLRREMESMSSRYMKDQKNIWQADVPTLRDGRTVLPLKANYRGRVQGIVHTFSGKGATVYIEPFDILELNNKITMRENEIILVIRKILKEITEAVAEKNEELLLLINQISFIDTLLARARFSVRCNCRRAELTENSIKLSGARHLLLGSDVVPIDVSLDKDLNALIITGPNAGGKTVTLKTIGLLALMNQFGMDIPAEEGSALPVYDAVYADIGDDQSLEDSLSTFSGHMKNISEIIKNATSHTLILLDEIGSGTDPAEGSSIAMAVLDNLVKKGSVVITTTHHGLLKNYGYTREHVLNASMEFDTVNHTPTYRIILGMPGESHAMEIAKQSGLSKDVIKQAENYLHSEQHDVSSMIKELERKQREIFEREKSLVNKIRQFDLKTLELKQKEFLLKKKGSGELQKYLNESRKNLENLVKELREGELSREKTIKVKQFLSGIEKKASQEKKIIQRITEETVTDNRSLEPGMYVEIGSFKRPGHLIRKEKNGNWLVQTGTVKMSFPPGEIKPAQKKEKQSKNFTVAISSVLSDNHPFFTLDIRGMRAEEAISTMTKQLDNAIMSGMREFYVIHGKGEGALGRIVHDVLRRSKDIKEFSFAKPEEGGAGKTIVRLKE